MSEPQEKETAAADETTSLLTLPSSTDEEEEEEEEEETSLPSSSLPWQTRFATEYCRLLDQSPVLIKSVTAFVILGGGDVLAQILQPDGWDAWRTLRFGLMGLLGAPWSHFYFACLDEWLPPTRHPWTGRTLLKVFIDQFLQAPLLLALMIGSLSLFKGQGWQVVRDDLAAHYWPSLVANWKFWITASFLNWAFVQPRFRVLFLNCGFFVWIVILSLLLNSSNDDGHGGRDQ